jgi:hypothetical protein
MIHKQRLMPAFLSLGYLSIFMSCLFYGWSKTWSLLLIPTMYPPFADMRTVQGSLYSISVGLDPQTENPGDPWERVMNYPSIWIRVADILNLQIESHFLGFVSVQITLFLTCLFILIKCNPSILLLLLCFSNATLLCLERGNNDLLVFTLIFLAIRYQNLVAAVIISAVVLLKIYPLLVLPAFTRRRKTFGVMLMGTVISGSILWTELAAIRNGTPSSYYLSYGSPSLSQAIKEQLNFNFSTLFISSSLVVFGLLVASLNTSVDLGNFKNSSDADRMMFISGSCVFVGTFLISSNFDYRLIFLLFCVPLALKWNKSILKYCFFTSLIAAFNFLPMVNGLGITGGVLNLAAKLFLLVLLLAILFKEFLRTLKQTILIRDLLA